MVRMKNFNQIVRIDGKNCFVEVLDSAFAIEKVQINFISYDDKTNKQVAMIPFYLDFSDFFVLETDVLSGKIAALVDLEKKKGNKYPSHIYMQQGGVSAANLKKRGQERADGMSLSRQFKIIPGNKYPFMVQGEQGKGEENPQGLIVSRYGAKPDDRVMVPMQGDDLKKFVMMTSAKIRAYMTAQYVYVYQEQFQQKKKEEEEKQAKYRKS